MATSVVDVDIRRYYAAYANHRLFPVCLSDFLCRIYGGAPSW